MSFWLMGAPVVLAALLGGAAVEPPAVGPDPRDRPASCTRHLQRDSTIYFHNDCGFNVWWAACVTFGWGDGELRQFNGLGVPPGQSDSFSPGPGPFTYRILQTGHTDQDLSCF